MPVIPFLSNLLSPLLAPLALLLLAFFPSPAVANWKLRPDRWKIIALRLEEMALQSPHDKYAVPRLFLHYKKQGSFSALQKRLASLASERPKDPRIPLLLAYVLLHAKKLPQALAAFQSLPPSPSLLFQIAEIQAQLGLLPQAFASFQALLPRLQTPPLRPLRLRSLRRIANLAEQLRRFPEAILALQALLALSPRDSLAQERLLALLSQEALPDKALAFLESILPLASPLQRLPLQKLQIQLSFQAGLFPKALLLLASLRRRLAPSHWLHNELDSLEIAIHRKQGTLPSLAALFLASSKSKPLLVLPRLALLYQELQEHDKAASTYQALLKLSPKHPAWKTYFAFLLSLQKFEPALLLLDSLQALAHDPDLHFLRIQLFHHAQRPTDRDHAILSVLRHPKLALSPPLLQKILDLLQKTKDSLPFQLLLFAQLCPLPPQRALCFDQWGDLLQQQGRSREAWLVWEKIASISPPHPDDLFLLAARYASLSPPSPKALPLLRKILALAPKHLRSRSLLAELLLNSPSSASPLSEVLSHFQTILLQTADRSLRQTARLGVIRTFLRSHPPHHALHLLQTQHLQDPFNPETHKLLLSFFLEARSFPQGSFFLRDALELYPDDPDFHFLASLFYARSPLAIPHLRRIIELDPPSAVRVLPSLLELARSFQKRSELLSLLQSLIKQFPQIALFWRSLGEEALFAKDDSLAFEAFHQTLRLEPSSLPARSGLAELFLSQKNYAKAYSLLKEPPFPTDPRENRLWLLRLWKLSRRLALPPALALRDLSPLVVSPHPSLRPASLSFLLCPRLPRHICLSLFPPPSPSLSSSLKSLLLASSKEDERFLAFFLLYHVDRPLLLSLQSSLLLDPLPSLRAAALLLFLHSSSPHDVLVLEKFERSDPFYLNRSFASLILSFRVDALDLNLWSRIGSHSPDWFQSLLFLFLFHKPSSDYLPALMQLYQTSSPPRKRLIFWYLALLPPSIITDLSYQTLHPYNACFLQDAFFFFRTHPDVPPSHKSLALRHGTTLDRLRYVCRKPPLSW